ncbi:MAG: hypothetical protein IJ489_02225 [Clostridia bacterium]|nr:hypothetical protein [Clostridia bacterium]
MDGIKNFFIGIKIKAETIACDVIKFVIDNSNFMAESRYYFMLNDCLTRTKNAYFSMCHTKAPQLITKRQLEIIINNLGTTHSFEQLKSDIQASCLSNDPIYVMLLTISIVETYKPKSIPELPVKSQILYLQ